MNKGFSLEDKGKSIPQFEIRTCAICRLCGMHLSVAGGMNSLEKDFHLRGKCLNSLRKA